MSLRSLQKDLYTIYMFYTAKQNSAYSAPLGTRFARLGSLRIASPAYAAVTRLCVKNLYPFYTAKISLFT